MFVSVFGSRLFSVHYLCAAILMLYLLTISLNFLASSTFTSTSAKIDFTTTFLNPIGQFFSSSSSSSSSDNNNDDQKSLFFTVFVAPPLFMIFFIFARRRQRLFSVLVLIFIVAASLCDTFLSTYSKQQQKRTSSSSSSSPSSRCSSSFKNNDSNNNNNNQKNNKNSLLFSSSLLPIYSFFSNSNNNNPLTNNFFFIQPAEAAVSVFGESPISLLDPSDIAPVRDSELNKRANALIHWIEANSEPIYAEKKKRILLQKSKMNKKKKDKKNSKNENGLLGLGEEEEEGGGGVGGDVLQQKQGGGEKQQEEQDEDPLDYENPFPIQISKPIELVELQRQEEEEEKQKQLLLNKKNKNDSDCSSSSSDADDMLLSKTREQGDIKNQKKKNLKNNKKRRRFSDYEQEQRRHSFRVRMRVNSKGGKDSQPFFRIPAKLVLAYETICSPTVFPTSPHFPSAKSNNVSLSSTFCRHAESFVQDANNLMEVQKNLPASISKPFSTKEHVQTSLLALFLVYARWGQPSPLEMMSATTTTSAAGGGSSSPSFNSTSSSTTSSVSDSDENNSSTSSGSVSASSDSDSERTQEKRKRRSQQQRQRRRRDPAADFFKPFIDMLSPIPPSPVCTFTEGDLNLFPLAQNIRNARIIYESQWRFFFDRLSASHHRHEQNKKNKKKNSAKGDDDEEDEDELTQQQLGKLFPDINSFTLPRYLWAMCTVKSKAMVCFSAQVPCIIPGLDLANYRGLKDVSYATRLTQAQVPSPFYLMDSSSTNTDENNKNQIQKEGEKESEEGAGGFAFRKRKKKKKKKSKKNKKNDEKETEGRGKEKQKDQEEGEAYSLRLSNAPKVPMPLLEFKFSSTLYKGEEFMLDKDMLSLPFLHRGVMERDVNSVCSVILLPRAEMEVATASSSSSSSSSSDNNNNNNKKKAKKNMTRAELQREREETGGEMELENEQEVNNNNTPQNKINVISKNETSSSSSSTTVAEGDKDKDNNDNKDGSSSSSSSSLYNPCAESVLGRSDKESWTRYAFTPPSSTSSSSSSSSSNNKNNNNNNNNNNNKNHNPSIAQPYTCLRRVDVAHVLTVIEALSLFDSTQCDLHRNLRPGERVDKSTTNATTETELRSVAYLGKLVRKQTELLSSYLTNIEKVLAHQQQSSSSSTTTGTAKKEQQQTTGAQEEEEEDPLVLNFDDDDQQQQQQQQQSHRHLSGIHSSSLYETSLCAASFGYSATLNGNSNNMNDCRLLLDNNNPVSSSDSQSDSSSVSLPKHAYIIHEWVKMEHANIVRIYDDLVALREKLRLKWEKEEERKMRGAR